MVEIFSEVMNFRFTFFSDLDKIQEFLIHTKLSMFFSY